MVENRIQQLYQVCKRTFRGARTPSAEALSEVRAVLDTLTAKDLNMEVPQEEPRGFGFFGIRNVLAGPSNLFSPSARLTNSSPSPSIKYLHIHECENFTIAVFCLPTSAVIPLHDHPGMVVMSKLLYGSMHIRSFDWQGEKPQGVGAQGRARLIHDQVHGGPAEPLTLFPASGGNIHAFTSISHCAVLDVLAPPYKPNEGRDCQYYSELEPGSKCVGADAFLVEIKAPDDFVVERGHYKGPAIVPDR
mmetsp:Transcript_35769/g.78080  ORF Transcript_35769/g.78080 Transcript_35769/m.78080 type:complete len:247 (+) Transcript_35769:180-920(+)|eukprot:CAMPEP_0118941862 /NCGR_PEP_ID=MMETSP1169-20130426/34853_1 /TAXON_ID=36882 /ORGANISM="Pyramimonas obovata, Strain CCMP722" /LENGTH=246 /DNA_ID=CAMNT_0006886737 /DNA_START=168 /DNA_END=908 /DNA_ORIENTATION=-